MADRCQATTREGNPCAARPLPGQTLCAWHTPTLAERRVEWSRSGGRGKSSVVRAQKAMAPAMGSGELLAFLSEALRKTEAGTLAPGQASAIAPSRAAWTRFGGRAKSSSG